VQCIGRPSYPLLAVRATLPVNVEGTARDTARHPASGKCVAHSSRIQFEVEKPSTFTGRAALRSRAGGVEFGPTVEDMDMPGFRLHPLKGEFKGYWAVTVRANRRAVFCFAGRSKKKQDLCGIAR